MSSFFTGDALGHIKSLRVTPKAQPSELTLLHSSQSAVAALSVASTSKIVAAAHVDGSISAFSFQEPELKPLRTWKEPRLKANQNFVGLRATDKGVYSCTSNGALRLVPMGEDEKPILGALPTRLCDWRLASDQTSFAYGGDEVELSVWDTEKALSQDPTSSDASGAAKRKRDALFPAEIWRARNVENDGLSLRQPVRITSLAYVSASTPTRIMTGTQLGDIRQYDLRARRPASNFKGIGKVGGIKVVEKGLNEHEAFVSDHGCNLFSLDLRNGRVVYSYKGLSGAVNSIAPSPSLLVSSALDRYCRVHTSFPPLPDAGQNQEKKGEVIEKVYMTSIPTVVVWDGAEPVQARPAEDDDDLWNEMENVDDEGSDDESNKKKKRRTHSKD
ncbi:hypothetical protein FB45DRAFT_978296 [Roridomyces roridus]|uniref:Ribosome biogenesis protein NSA1 n=1 Tax=Roridomyces roridus TaxID=1738132 RepID=A0AAD7FMB4_9AGAR|nr:hypothetical protein FB45DRAFT_978296 [Roridomyces roridus]